MIILQFKEDKVVLNGPDWNDSHSVDTGLNLKRSMDGTVRTYIKKPLHEKSLTISKINRPAAEKIYNFLIKSYGNEITYTEYFNLDADNTPDHKNPSGIWTGKVTTPIETIHQAVRDSRFNITFEGYGSPKFFEAST